jgi:antitoxin CcdA
MRMTRRGVKDPRRPFQAPPETPKHSGHIGPGPKPGPKRAVNVSVDAEILAVAKDLGLNLSHALEDALRKLTEEERGRRWREANREALESHNAFFERNGTMTEALWTEEGLEWDDPTV